MIPMSPDEIMGVWKSVKDLEFDTTFGAFVGMEVRDEGLKGRMLMSMQTQVRTGGWKEHQILEETV